MRRLQNIPIERTPGIPTPSSSELLPGCSGCCPHSFPVSLTGKFLSSSATQVKLIFSQDPELRQEMVTSTMPEIYKQMCCSTIMQLRWMLKSDFGHRPCATTVIFIIHFINNFSKIFLDKANNGILGITLQGPIGLNWFYLNGESPKWGQ